VLLDQTTQTLEWLVEQLVTLLPEKLGVFIGAVVGALVNGFVYVGVLVPNQDSARGQVGWGIELIDCRSQQPARSKLAVDEVASIVLRMTMICQE
jgi:hypothetical protein